MKRILLETSFSKIYMIVMILISVLLLGGYFSYAMFTVSKEKSNAISIVTGNLTYKLEVDGKEDNKLVVNANSSKEFIITLSNPNNRTSRFNFYYLGDLPERVDIGYVEDDGYNITPDEKGINLEKSGTSGSSNTYIIRVSNITDEEVTINLGVEVGLDYNDLSLPENGHLFRKIEYRTVAEIILADQGENGNTYNDGVDTFITGEDPNNYIWYSGKLWRAVSVNNSAKTTKLVTQWNISTVNYNITGNATFEGSYMEDWLNDISVDGFLGNLREPDKFIVTDSKWDDTIDDRMLGSITRPNGTTITDAVGLLNMYEYQSSYHGTSFSNGYLNNGLYFWTLTPFTSSEVRPIDNNGNALNTSPSHYSYGVRPSINLKSNVKIVAGDGTIDNPYRLLGDNDTNLSGTSLSSRYSGEYLRFGNGKNNLYRIVSHENSIGTKIVSSEPLNDGNKFITSMFGSDVFYTNNNTIGAFLNGEYLRNYLDNNYIAMIEDSNIWYLGEVGIGISYRLSKYKDKNSNELTSYNTISKIGLLRFAELMAGQFNNYKENVNYWTLTPFTSSIVLNINFDGNAYSDLVSNSYCGIKPALNLKSNIIITSGDGTKENPFNISLG